jgi:restriction endonuclease S subunit
VEGQFEAATITAVLQPKDKSVPVAQVFYYLLAHKDDLLVPLMRGSTNKSLNLDRLLEMKVPVPSKGSPEFELISRLIELRDGVRSANERALALSREHERELSRLRRLRVSESNGPAG